MVILALGIEWGIFSLFRGLKKLPDGSVTLYNTRWLTKELSQGTVPSNEDVLRLIREEVGCPEKKVFAIKWQDVEVKGDTEIHSATVSLSESVELPISVPVGGTFGEEWGDVAVIVNGATNHFALRPKYEVPQMSDPVDYGRWLLTFLDEHKDEPLFCMGCTWHGKPDDVYSYGCDNYYNVLSALAFEYLLSGLHSKYYFGPDKRFVFHPKLGFVNEHWNCVREQGELVGVSFPGGCYGAELRVHSCRDGLKKIEAERAAQHSATIVDRTRLRAFLASTKVPLDSWGDDALERLADELEHDVCQLTVTYRYWDRCEDGYLPITYKWDKVNLECKGENDVDYHVVRTTGEVRLIVDKVRNRNLVRTEVHTVPVPLHVCHDRNGTDISDLIEMLERYCAIVNLQPRWMNALSFKRNPEILLRDKRACLPETYPGIVDMVDSFTMRAYTERYVME